MNTINSGIYKITNSLDAKFYIGSAVNIDKRFYMHHNQLNHNKHRNAHLQRAWNKHGPDVFEFLVLQRVPRDELISVEQRFLDETKAVECGYNICSTATNRSGCKHSAETIERMRLAQLGKRHSEVSKAAMSASKKGVAKQPRTQEHRANIGLAHKGKTISEETKAKRKKTLAVNGYKASPETRRRMSESMKKTLAIKKQEKVRVEAFESAAERAGTDTCTREQINELLLKAI